MKKIFSILLCVALLVGAIATLVACDDTKKTDAPTTVMNLSLNPEVEFVLDGNDVVLSANALNEEGNMILASANFVGLSADAAAELFVSISRETGFIVKGNANIAGNEIEIEISGDVKAAEELFNQVKTKVQTYLSAENITAKIEQVEAITKAELEKLVAECEPYLEMAEIQKLEYMQLVEKLYESRKETINMYSQEVKNAYYEAKAFALEQAELEVLKSKVTGIAQSMLEMAYNGYTTAVANIEQARLTHLVNEGSLYQQSLKAFREKKIEYLKYREEVAQMEPSQLTEAITNRLDLLEDAVDTAESALLAAGETGNDILDGLKTIATEAYNAVVNLIETSSVKLADHLTEVSEKQQAQKEQFFADFEANYANAIQSAKTNWEDMKTELEQDATTQPEPQA